MNFVFSFMKGMWVNCSVLVCSRLLSFLTQYFFFEWELFSFSLVTASPIVSIVSSSVTMSVSLERSSKSLMLFLSASALFPTFCWAWPRTQLSLAGGAVELAEKTFGHLLSLISASNYSWHSAHSSLLILHFSQEFHLLATWPRRRKRCNLLHAHQNKVFIFCTCLLHCPSCWSIRCTQGNK